jgi:hypothetical protein
MKKWMLMGLATGLMACNSNSSIDEEIVQLRQETIAVHDEIMPQISDFDRKGLKIDELLGKMDSLKISQADLDTSVLISDLKHTKGRLEGATDAMNRWMIEFNIDSLSDKKEDVKSYYQKELKRVQDMKRTFEEVTKESTDQLARFL